MASPAGLPFLLLLSSALLISAVIGQNQLQKRPPQSSERVKKLKEFGTLIISNIDKITSVGCPFLSLIPVVGSVISDIVKFAASEIKGYTDLDLIMDEFENLNAKLDQYHADQLWNTWASTYSKTEINIDVAWTMFTTLRKNLRKTNNVQEKERYIDDFKTSYVKYEQATKKLHALMKNKLFNKPLQDSLAEHVKCHEKPIRQYTVLVNILVYKGNTMNSFYYGLKNIELAKADEQAEIAYGISSLMFQLHVECIKRSMDYIKKDVEARIDKTKPNSDLAKDIWSFLVDVYDRYDWMVVAFKTKKSQHKTFKVLNRHVLSGFTEVNKTRVSVAVARQVKGTHTKAREVKQALDRCIKESVLCYKVAEKISQCTEKVGGKPVSQMYTAVHAYLRVTHDEHSAQDIPDDVSASPEDDQIPYIYRGKCHKAKFVKGGKFVVLIKSDEEIMAKDPCSKLDCGKRENRGSCVPMKDLFLAVCQCNYPYYGQNCEEKLDHDKKKVPPTVVDKRRRPAASG